MNKGTVTKLKNWLVANFNIKLVESSSTDSFYLTNDSVSIRISDHIQGSDFNKIRFDISIILPEETNQYIVSIGYKVYIYNSISEVKQLLITIFRICEGIPESTIRNCVTSAVNKTKHKYLEVISKLVKTNKKLNKSYQKYHSKSIQLEKIVTKCEKEIKRLKLEILNLEEKANDYKLIADNMTRSRAHYLHECESLVDKYNSLMNDYNSLVEKYNAL
jgi:hypothetical protein